MDREKMLRVIDRMVAHVNNLALACANASEGDLPYDSMHYAQSTYLRDICEAAGIGLKWYDPEGRAADDNTTYDDAGRYIGRCVYVSE